MNDRPTPTPPTAARLFLLVVGAGLVLGGIGGFIYESDFGRGEDLVSDDIVGIFPTNGIDNVLHLVAGVISLVAASRAARPAALAVGGLLALIGIWGLLETERGFGTLAETIPVDTADNLLHLLLGIAGLAAASLGSREARDDRSARRRPPRSAQGSRLRS